MWFPWQESTVQEKRSGRWLRWRIVAGLLMVSSVPFLVVGSGAWIVFRKLAIERTLEAHRTMARAHATAIDLYLTEKLHTLEMVAEVNTLDQVVSGGSLRDVFAAAANVHEDAFVDLGVIDDRGRHLAYIGPFDLMDRSYEDAEWFQAVMAQRAIVSDVFLGHRQAPHSVIAVRRESPSGWWILRATLDNRSLYGLVRSLEVGSTGDVFILNREGLYQTPPRSGEVLDPSPFVNPPVHSGVRDQRLESPTGTILQVTTWLNGGRWLLVVQQPEREILAPVHRAMANGVVLAGAALALVLFATTLVTSNLTRRIDLADHQRDLMYADLLRSAKLASLGELATGLAHEINNPLAIISAEQTNLGDEISETELPSGTRECLMESVDRCKRQVDRCGNITAKMLQFGRQTGTQMRATEVGPVLREIGTLMERRARANNVSLRLDLDPDLPFAWVDSNELEQVVVNLVNNAIDALEGGGNITITGILEGDRILLQVRDGGSGIAPGDMERIFQPFFTTKPVGRGTGLGLSVVYGIVRGWGGAIDAESSVGRGTTMSVRIPVAGESQRASP
jgi:two-component system NtrC family sensor kinase